MNPVFSIYTKYLIVPPFPSLLSLSCVFILNYLRFDSQITFLRKCLKTQKTTI